jgi:hypothetical protein
MNDKPTPETMTIEALVAKTRGYAEGMEGEFDKFLRQLADALEREHAKLDAIIRLKQSLETGPAMAVGYSWIIKQLNDILKGPRESPIEGFLDHGAYGVPHKPEQPTAETREQLRQECVSQLLSVLQLNPDQGAPFRVTKVVDAFIALVDHIESQRQAHE